MGCNFCTTSAFYGGKGNFINFYETGEDLFRVMCEAEERLKVSCFFMMDENFLLHKKRALALLDLMKAHDKAWSMYVFSSANALAKYSMRQLVELGVSWVWIGLESAESNYAKLNGADTMALTAELRSHGIRVQGSTIVGLEHHNAGTSTPRSSTAVAHECDSHQFMLYTPVPGTPLHARCSTKDACSTWTSPTSTASTSSTSRTPHIPRELFETAARPGLPPRLRAQRPVALPADRDDVPGWLRYRTIRTARAAARRAGSLGAAHGVQRRPVATERYLRDEGHAIVERVAALRASSNASSVPSRRSPSCRGACPLLGHPPRGPAPSGRPAARAEDVRRAPRSSGPCPQRRRYRWWRRPPSPT